MTVNDELAGRVLVIIDSRPPRTPERRAAAAVYVALSEASTPAAARRCLATFGTPQTQASARQLLGELLGEASAP